MSKERPTERKSHAGPGLVIAAILVLYLAIIVWFFWKDLLWYANYLLSFSGPLTTHI